jgi:hypothetical protein
MGGTSGTWPLCERVKRKRPARVLAGSKGEQQGEKEQKFHVQYSRHSITSSAASAAACSVSGLVTGRTNFVGSETKQSLIQLILFRLSCTPTPLSGADFD